MRYIGSTSSTAGRAVTLTTITFFPAANAADRVRFMSETDLTDKRGARRPRVLVLEDHADTLAFLGKILSDLPIDAVPTASCTAARYAAKTLGDFDILIADITLDDGDGLELARELKRDHHCAVVVMSGLDIPLEGPPPWVDLWLVKPVRLPELKQAIDALSAK
jgi:DNA-binding response OmpR family regulator